MPTPGKVWHHLIFNTRGSWLTGDPRGFRSRNHRKHSGGDYKHPPAPGQHAELYRVVRGNSRKPVVILPPLFEPIGTAVIDKCQQQGHDILATSIDSHHAHVLAELPDDRKQVKQIVGAWKQKASHAVREQMPGSIWSKSSDPIRISGRAHQQRVFCYILEHAKQGSWVWSFRDGA